jgi:RNA polymerase sigma-70 factor, ECF subfamily
VSDASGTALADVFHEEWPLLIGAAMRIVGDLQTAEDVVQETVLTALDRWPLQGVPDRSGAWLMTACRNRARNVVRDSGRARRAIASMPLSAAEPHPGDADPASGSGMIGDDRLRLIALCCHPALTADAQVALTLRMVCGLTTEEIARGCHLPTTAIAQRIVRAKRVLRECDAAFVTDEPDIRARLSAILDVIYLVFNEGYLAAVGETLTRGDLAFEAYRLACLVTELIAIEPEPWALRALIAFQLSRWATRTSEEGAILTLDQQDRAKWNQELIVDGARALNRARAGEAGPLLLQAELAACHCTAASFDATDWHAIVAIYDRLQQVQDTPVVAMNRAVAVAMRDGPGAALPLLDRLATDPALAGSHRVWAVRADLHRRLGDQTAATADYERALKLVANQAERQYLETALRGMAARFPEQNNKRRAETDVAR